MYRRQAGGRALTVEDSSADARARGRLAGLVSSLHRCYELQPNGPGGRLFAVVFFLPTALLAVGPCLYLAPCPYLAELSLVSL